VDNTIRIADTAVNASSRINELSLLLIGQSRVARNWQCSAVNVRWRRPLSSCPSIIELSFLSRVW